MHRSQLPATVACVLVASVGCQDPSGARVPTGRAYWVNAAGGAWNNPANWEGGIAPGESDTVFIAKDGTYTIEVPTRVTIAALVMGAASGTQTLDVGPAPLSVSGNLVVGSRAILTRSASAIDVGGDLTIQGSLTSGSGAFSVGGAVSVQAGASLNVGGTSGGSQFSASNGFTSAGVSTIGGTAASTLTVTGTFSHGTGAVLRGSGTLDLTNVTASAFDGAVNPGTSPGLLTIMAPAGFALGAGAVVNIELGSGTIAGTDFDQLRIMNQPVTLGGTLNVTLPGGYTPAMEGRLFPVLVYPGHVGTFASITFPTIPGVSWGPSYGRADTLFVGSGFGPCGGGAPNSLAVVTVSLTRFCSAPGIVATAAEALSLVQPGGIVQFESGGGTFKVPSLLVDKPVRFQSADAGRPILQPGSNGFLVRPQSGTVTFNGLEFAPATSTVIAVGASSYDQVVVEHSIFTLNSGFGVSVQATTVPGGKVILRNNVFTLLPGVQVGVLGGGAGSVTDILNNQFTGPSTSGMVQFQGGATGRIEGNTLSSAGGSTQASINVSTAAPGLTITGNVITTNPGLGARSGIRVAMGGTASASIRNNTVTGGFSGGDPAVSANYGFATAGIELTGVGALTEVVGNTITGAVAGILGPNVAGQLLSVQNNVIGTVLTGVSGSLGATVLRNNDVTTYVNPFSAGFTAGQLVCNWWGSAAGPQNVPGGTAAGVYTPWAVAPIANGAGGQCTGVTPAGDSWSRGPGPPTPHPPRRHDFGLSRASMMTRAASSGLSVTRNRSRSSGAIFPSAAMVSRSQPTIGAQ